MYRGLSVIAIVPVFNEEAKIGKVVRRMPRQVVDEVVVVDDGSTDRSVEVARSFGAEVISMGATLGVGAALRAGYRYAIEQGYDVVVTVAGNNKDAPEEIPLLLEPIAENRADFVQGSRFLKRGANLGAMPAYRQIATRLHPVLFSLVARASLLTRASTCRKPGCGSTSSNPTYTCGLSSSGTARRRFQ